MIHLEYQHHHHHRRYHVFSKQRQSLNCPLQLLGTINPSPGACDEQAHGKCIQHPRQDNGRSPNDTPVHTARTTVQGFTNPKTQNI